MVREDGAAEAASRDDAPAPPLQDGDASVSPDVIAWVNDRVRMYTEPIFRSPRRFYGRWHLRDLVFRMMQQLDSADHTCLYLAVNNNRQSPASSRRVHSNVGLNRNPMENIRMRNARYTRSKSVRRAGWKLLMYVRMEKRRYRAEGVQNIGRQIAKHKGVEGKLNHMMQFALAHKLDTYIAGDMLVASHRWYMPSVKSFMARHKQFSRGVRRIGQPGPGGQ
jgi:hypothetical protein